MRVDVLNVRLILYVSRKIQLIRRYTKFSLIRHVWSWDQ